MAGRKTVLRGALFAAAAMLVAMQAAKAQELAETLSVTTPVWYFGSYDLRLEGFTSGSVFAASQDSGPGYDSYDDTGATGLALASVRLQRLYDSGLITGARANFLLVHDALSGDNYGDDFLQKIYFYVQTGIGRVEIGQQDGAGYIVGITGPQIDGHVSIENPDSVFFRNPITGDAFNEFTEEITLVRASSNAAKISYISPRLFGVQLGASYTPNRVKGPLPFVFGNPGNGPNTQASIFEFAASYTGRLGDLDMGISAAYARGALRNPTPGSGDIYDMALGIQFQGELGETDIAFGGGYRASSGYGFSPGTVYHAAESERLFLSALATRDQWRLGGEYSNTAMDAASGVPEFVITAWQAALGYELNDNFQLTAGWQFYNYERSIGVFYNGNSRMNMDAGFLSLGFTLQ